MSMHHYTQKEISQIKRNWLQALYIFFGWDCISILFNITTEIVNEYSFIRALCIAVIAYSLLFFFYWLSYYYGYKKPWNSFLLVSALFGFLFSVCGIILKLSQIGMIIIEGSSFDGILLINVLSSLSLFAVRIYYYYMSYKLYCVYDLFKMSKIDIFTIIK
ncbi:hypothetical protein [Candidatus Chromulinivorax destructor]|uniref:Uncharacterized protein n=1 Tax=Candidatus Chromulinivorax destructor TaxID=2066483 RepID=A0A345ZCC3_9BACT|nr:hypothetical protein [Candidatus Chromulinivorax destructor]AXK60940.1 hypothetical protein C0J27_04360 [Candidatus Chromulinivorax destructor]